MHDDNIETFYFKIHEMWLVNRVTSTLTPHFSRFLLTTKRERLLLNISEKPCEKSFCVTRGETCNSKITFYKYKSKTSSSVASYKIPQLKIGNTRLSSNKKDSSSDEKTFIAKYIAIWRENPLPIWIGLLLIAALQYRRLQREKKHPEPSNVEPVEAKPIALWLVQAYEQMPLDFLSRLVGYILNDITLPEWAREPIISWYAHMFQCKIFEAEKGDEWNEYKTLGEFFRRRLKKDARPIHENATLTSPCDGRVLSCGPIEASGKLEQVKGASYLLKDFLGNYIEPSNESGNGETVKSETYKYVPKKNTRLYQCTLYLAPGDYHCFHAPTDWNVMLRRHFIGKLLSVGPSVMGKIPHLMSLNERVIYFGKWHPDRDSKDNHGYFFSFAAVGATNVGSIKVEIDNDLKTNPKGKFKKSKSVEEQWFNSVETASNIQKGSYFGEFNLGSSIVIVMEAPLDFTFDVKNGEKVKVGQPLIKLNV